MNEHLSAPPAARAASPTPWRALRSLCLYAAAAVVATAFFFWLHHLGNGIPYELAQQRFAAAPLTGESDSDVRVASEYEYCEMAAAILAGAMAENEYSELADAVLLRVLRRESRNYCTEVGAASSGADIASRLIKFRYWWGGKAIFAIALRWLSVVDFQRFLEIATYVAWLLFTCAMALHGPRALAIALPPISFGLAFSGISSISDTANGLPYLWTVSAAALFVSLLSKQRMAHWVPPFCFVTGMISSYLWHFDGHNFIVVALFGTVAWLALAGVAPRIRARRALGYVAFYIAGFIICFALGQTTKAVIFDRMYSDGSGILNGPVAQDLLGQTVYHLDRTASPEARDGRDLTNKSFVYATPWLTKTQGRIVIAFSAVALAAAVAGAVFLAARRREFDPAWTCLWFVMLTLMVGLSYVLPNNTPVRSARYLFLPLALCWSCLVAVAWNLWGLRRALAVVVGALVVAAWPGGSVLLKQRLWQDDVEATLADATPVARADFDVYIMEDGRGIVYVKEPCARGGRPPWVKILQGGWRLRFFLDWRRKDEHRRERIDFNFYEADFAIRDNSRCVAMLLLPAPIYDLKSIETGQSDKLGRFWGVGMEFMDSDAKNSPDMCGDLSDVRVYGNNAAPYAVYIDGGGAGRCNFTLESDIWGNIVDASDIRDPISLWIEQYAEHGDYLVWIEDASVSQLSDYDAADLRGQAELIEVVKLGGGSIFRMNASGSGETSDYRATWRSTAAGVPTARSFFDVHAFGRKLAYLREPCGRSDTASRFFLHIFPIDAGELPRSRAEHGFDNLDFEFQSVGARFDGKCIATVRLPSYGIDRVRTGQWDDKGESWSVGIAFHDGAPRTEAARPASAPR